jgi:hypothetical protein
MKSVLLTLIILFLANIEAYKDVCTPDKYGNITYIKCSNVTWTYDNEEFFFAGKTFNISNYAPNHIWLDENGTVIGMSSDTKSIFGLSTNVLNNVTSDILKRALLSVQVSIPEDQQIYKNPDEELIDFMECKGCTGTCPWEEYIETHLFDHENVLDWCINLFFGPQKKYQTSYSKKLFKKNLIVELEQNMIVEGDAMNVTKILTILCRSIKKCQLLKTCETKNGEKSTYRMNLYEDLSKTPITHLTNCREWDYDITTEDIEIIQNNIDSGEIDDFIKRSHPYDPKFNDYEFSSTGEKHAPMTIREPSSIGIVSLSD